ncbi:MFS transporter [Sphingomonas quercus]|nr:MFS transporter [Sphingomonas quercus]
MHEPPGRRRWAIAALLGGGVVVSYFDRIILAAAAPAIQRDFRIDDFAMGFLLGAFGWTYGALQVPVGVLLDRIGVRRVMIGSILLWAAASFLASEAIGFATMFAARMMLGVAEAPTFPANAKAIGYWFPRTERSLATALFDGAAKFSNVIAIPAIAFLALEVGWRKAFVATAILSLCYLLLFARIYRDPGLDPRLGPSERAYIAEGGGAAEGLARSRGLALLGYLLLRRKMWGLALGFGCYNYAFSFFITWLPTYLAREMKMDPLSSAGFAIIPWMFATLADLLVGGWLIDHLVRRGRDETIVRKSIIVLGMVTALFVIGAAFTDDARWALLWITVSLSGLAAAAPASWSLPSLIAPVGGAGTIGGMMNFVGSLAGAVAPALTGLIVAQSRSFSGAFLLAGAVLAVGLVSFTLVMGPIAPIPEREQRRHRN